MKDVSQKKLKVAVLFGGQSGEHEVSLQSAASVIRNLDPSRFEVVPVAIDQEGRWLLQDLNRIDRKAKSLSVDRSAPAFIFPTSFQGIDLVFPVIHGPLCEDGTVQGLLELANVPYVGCGVLSSAMGMDKEIAKRIIRDAGLPIVSYVAVRGAEWKRSPAAVADQIQRELGFPVFVKPANQGSSVGVHKVKELSSLASALNDAFRYDTKVLVEKAVDAREIEISVLENIQDPLQPQVSVVGEVLPSHEFYSYEAKYLDEQGAALMIPAQISSEQSHLAQKIAFQAFLALECEGMARVDLFLDKKTDQFYFNEVNTIPGFTSISMYPKMWQASHIEYPELLSKLIDLALARYARKKSLLRQFQV